MKASPVLVNISWQLAFLLPIVSVLGLNEPRVAKSFALGGAVFIIAHAYFVAYAFRYNGAQWQYLALRAFKWGQTGKIILSVLLFILIFLVVPVRNDLALFVGYVVMIALQWWISTKVLAGLGV